MQAIKENIQLAISGVKSGLSLLYHTPDLNVIQPHVAAIMGDIRSELASNKDGIRFYSYQGTARYQVFSKYITLYDWNNRLGGYLATFIFVPQGWELVEGTKDVLDELMVYSEAQYIDAQNGRIRRGNMDFSFFEKKAKSALLQRSDRKAMETGSEGVHSAFFSYSSSDDLRTFFAETDRYPRLKHFRRIFLWEEENQNLTADAGMTQLFLQDKEESSMIMPDLEREALHAQEDLVSPSVKSEKENRKIDPTEVAPGGGEEPQVLRLMDQIQRDKKDEAGSKSGISKKRNLRTRTPFGKIIWRLLAGLFLVLILLFVLSQFYQHINSQADAKLAAHRDQQLVMLENISDNNLKLLDSLRSLLNDLTDSVVLLKRVRFQDKTFQERFAREVEDISKFNASLISSTELLENQFILARKAAMDSIEFARKSTFNLNDYRALTSTKELEGDVLQLRKEIIRFGEKAEDQLNMELQANYSAFQKEVNRLNRLLERKTKGPEFETWSSYRSTLSQINKGYSKAVDQRKLEQLRRLANLISYYDKYENAETVSEKAAAQVRARKIIDTPGLFNAAQRSWLNKKFIIE